MNSFDYSITRCISYKSKAEFTMPNFCNYGYASSLEFITLSVVPLAIPTVRLQ
jgi:hypothetical protein